MLARPLSLVFLGLVATSLLGCGREPRERLQGNWQGDSVDGLSGDRLAKAEGWAKGARLEFVGNKVTVGVPAESPRSGTFRVAQIDGDRVKVQFKRPDDGGCGCEVIGGVRTTRAAPLALAALVVAAAARRRRAPPAGGGRN